MSDRIIPPSIVEERRVVSIRTNMKHLVIFVVFLGACSAIPLRIVNGTDAQEGEFKYVVSVRQSLSHICGGTIINNRFVLTAAHCVCDDATPRNASLYSIQYGSVNISRDAQRSINVKVIKCGPFSMDALTYDVAVLQLATDIPPGINWEPAVLSQSFDSSIQHSGIVVGWGRLYQDGPIPITLQKLNVRTLTNNICGLRFNNDHHVCLTTTLGGVCNGDSGTSLVVNGVQVGIASFITNRCGSTSALTPNVYARVPTYYSWIEENSGI